MPGIGIKSAQRIAFHILKMPAEESLNLAEALLRLREQIRYCSVCWNFTDTDPCKICSDPRRDEDVICVVEEPTTLIAVEKTREFHGKYHVLLGCLNPLQGIDAVEGQQRIAVRHTVAVDVQQRAAQTIGPHDP